MKNFKFALAALVAAAGLVTSVEAAEVAAYRGHPIDLGTVTGIAYFTVEQGGYHVVATLSDADGKSTVRFEAVLARGQSIVLSSPGGRGASPARIEISRVGEHVEVTSASATN